VVLRFNSRHQLHIYPETAPGEEERTMAEKNTSWVVYLMTLHNQEPAKAVCDQAEWEALEMARPGYHKLVRSGIASENEAEKLARGTSGDTRKSGSGKPRS
jgi:hypothetical protein